MSKTSKTNNIAAIKPATTIMITGCKQAKAHALWQDNNNGICSNCPSHNKCVAVANKYSSYNHYMSGVPTDYLDARFAGIVKWYGEDLSTDVMTYAEDTINKPSRKVLYLHGKPGTGKTYAAAAIIREVGKYAPDYKLVWVNVPAVVRTLSTGSYEDRCRYINQVCEAHVVVLDDLRVRNQSPASLRIIDDIIRSRYDYGLNTIITTNKTLKDLTQDMVTLYGDDDALSLADRIRHGYEAIHFAGASQRTVDVKEKKNKK